ncbi:MAG: TonB-dependent receptor, partial [Flavobacteriales bacterium]|nr:TonB-dependent receptor [Flavobacteriales bacterium]
NKVLSNSDFFTGAFPAEFGNSISSVFDLKLRNGNNEKHEFTAQLGLFGTELTGEGPISKEKRSSYLFNYRYSTLVMFGFLGINLGTTATPYYQDAALKLNFPTKNGGNLSFFGLGGASKIDILSSTQDTSQVDIYADADRDEYFRSQMGVIGMKYVKSINTNTFAKFVVATSGESQINHNDLLYRSTDSTGRLIIGSDGRYVLDSLINKLDYDINIHKTTATFSINKKYGKKHVLKYGATANYYRFNMVDSIFNNGTTNDWTHRWDYKGDAVMLQSFIQWKYRMSKNLVLNTGIHSSYFALNNSLSPIEPRIGLRYSMKNNQSLNFAVGLHSQLQPMYTYFYQLPNEDGNYVKHNKGMDFTKSMHYIVGYNNQLAKNLRVKVEAYYQQLFNVPVTAESSSFSLVNQGSSFNRFFPEKLTNSGTGQNYGMELTLEKFFNKKFFFMTTASLYESLYKGSDGVIRNTDFNGNYAVNFLAGKEFKLGEKKSLSIGLKITAAGNKRIGPVDSLATVTQGGVVFEDATRNSQQLPDYFRADLKINYKANRKNVSHEIGLDFVNLTGHQNVLKLTYAPDPNNPTVNGIRHEYQLGFLPIFYYKLDF